MRRLEPPRMEFDVVASGALWNGARVDGAAALGMAWALWNLMGKEYSPK
jgi:hypothetical protein